MEYHVPITCERYIFTLTPEFQYRHLNAYLVLSVVKEGSQLFDNFFVYKSALKS